MRPAAPLVGLAVAIGMVSPAAADWSTRDLSLLGSYQAIGVTEDERAKFMIECYIGYHDVFDVMIFTGERYDPESSYAPDVSISVMTDGRQQPTVSGVFGANLGELTVQHIASDTATDTDKTWLQVIGAMAASTSTIDVRFYQREYRFSSEGLAPAMRYLDEKCR